jgi:hypothetical protein
MRRLLYAETQRPSKMTSTKRSKDSVSVREVNCSREDLWDSLPPKDSLPSSLDDAGCDGGSWSQRGREVGLPLRLKAIASI